MQNWWVKMQEGNEATALPCLQQLMVTWITVISNLMKVSGIAAPDGPAP